MSVIAACGECGCHMLNILRLHYCWVLSQRGVIHAAHSLTVMSRGYEWEKRSAVTLGSHDFSVRGLTRILSEGCTLSQC